MVTSPVLVVQHAWFNIRKWPDQPLHLNMLSLFQDRLMARVGAAVQQPSTQIETLMST